MTGREALVKLKIQINKLDTDSNKVLYPEVGLVFLNNTYRSLVEAKYSMDPNNKTGMSKGQKVEDELMHLITRYNLTGPTDSEGKIEVESSAIEDYLYYLDTDELICSGVKTLEVRSKPAGRNAVAASDPFNKPSITYPTLQQYEGKLVYSFFVPNAEVTGKLVYLKKPPIITLDDEFEMPFPIELINTAATEILENWEDQRFASKTQIDQATKNH